MNIKETSLRLAAISLIADEAKKAKDKLRAELQAQMDELGADRVKAELGDEIIAYVTTSKPKFKWQITNERGFINWVKDYFPSEITESVREGSVDKLLEKLSYLDDHIIDHNGEFIDWALGVESEPYLMTKFHSDGREKLRSAIVGKAIDPREILELE
jgi:hypothetical protein